MVGKPSSREHEVMVSVTAAVSPLKIVVVADDPATRRQLKEILEARWGHQVVAEAVTATEMVRAVLAQEPDLVVFETRLRDGQGLDALQQIYQERPVAAVALTNEHAQGEVQSALGEYHMAYVLSPVEPAHLEPALLVAWARLNVYRQLRDENNNLKQTLQNRKVIERAKGVLMKRFRCSEDVAFRRLQRGAMNRRTTMVHLAQDILNGVEVDI
jgi:response regulator NasT